MHNISETGGEREAFELTAPFSDGPFTSVKPDLLVPLEVAAECRFDRQPDIVFQVGLKWSADDAKFFMAHMGITSTSGISTSDVHAVSVPNLVMAASSSAIMIDLHVIDPVKFEQGSFTSFDEYVGKARLDELRDFVKKNGPVAASLKWVGRVYAFSRATGAPNPNNLVSKVLDLPQRTATRWIARARAEGWLD